MKNKIVTALTGLVTGFANGLLGAGGGTILVPAMQRFLGIETHKSHATAIAVILPLSVLSAFLYIRSGGVDLRTVLYVSAGGAVGGFVGARVLSSISSRNLHRIFGVFMAVAAIRMIFGGDAGDPLLNPGNFGGLIYVLLGFLAGVISGMGIGGGTVLIPALVILFGMAQREAQNINLIYFIPTAIIALFVHFKNGAVEKKPALKIALFGLVGAAGGSLLAVNLDATILRKAFGFFLLIMGCFEFFKKADAQESRCADCNRGNSPASKGCDEMENLDFGKIRSKFAEADIQNKIDMYISTEGLTKDQYLELLRMFPVSELPRLEAAVAAG